MPSLISGFLNSAKSIITWGASVNAKQRAEIRDTVMKLASELDRSMSLVVIYLEGARDIDENGRLATYLRDARGKLLHTCDEFNVCSALYGLHDRFNQVFDLTKGAVQVSEVKTIGELLDTLRQKERGVIDEIGSSLYEMEKLAGDLTAGKAQRSDLIKLVTETAEEMKRTQKSIKRVARGILDKM